MLTHLTLTRKLMKSSGIAIGMILVFSGGIMRSLKNTFSMNNFQRSFALGCLMTTLLGAQAWADAPTMPPDEQAFVALIGKYNNADQNASNDMQKSTLRRNRGNDICALLQSENVQNWVGTISSLDSTGDGRGILELTISSDLSLGTTNNSMSESMESSPTMIPAGSALFTAVSAMKTGDTVVFSGNFLRNSTNGDCFEELSMTTDGSLTSPEFTFRFSSVSDASSGQ